MMEQFWRILLALLVLLPVIALIGGIIAAILKTAGQQRQIELAQRERIAAIEHGIDPNRLPPLSTVAGAESDPLQRATPDEHSRRQSQRFLIAGVVTLTTGLGLMTFFSVTEDHGNAWALGILPISVAIGLFLCAFLTHPRGRSGR